MSNSKPAADQTQLVHNFENAFGDRKRASDAHIDKVNDARSKWKLVYETILNPHTGDTFFLKAGHVLQ